MWMHRSNWLALLVILVLSCCHLVLSEETTDLSDINNELDIENEAFTSSEKVSKVSVSKKKKTTKKKSTKDWNKLKPEDLEKDWEEGDEEEELEVRLI